MLNRNSSEEVVLSMTWILVAIIVALLVLVVRLAGRSQEVGPAPKTFGLKEARAARGFIATSDQAKAVKAVVVGVLGYADMVATDVEVAADELDRAKDSNVRRIGAHEAEIENLEARIAALHASNDGIDGETANLASLRSLFS